MLTYSYTARDPATGKKIKANVQADSEAAAAKLVQKEGLAPLSVKLIDTDSNNPLYRFKNRVRTKEKIIFSRQMSTLINAGLPLLQSLRNVSSQITGQRFKAVVDQVISDVEGGSSLADAMRKHPKVFNNIFINLIAAGETSGTLDKALARLADQQEKDAEITSKIRGAMAYPLIVVMVMLLVVGFMVVRVLPEVEKIYQDIPGVSLPLITQIMLAISHFVTSYWWVTLIIIGGLAFASTRWAATIGGRRVIDGLKMKAWPVGPLFMKVYMARFARTGSTLVASGVPLIQMLDIVAKSFNNVHLEASINRAIDKVRGGKSLADSLEGDPNFLQLVPDMLRIGEQSGSLEDMLEKTADYYEKEVDNQIKTISTIIEPLLMVLLGIMAFTVVAAVLLPIYGLVGKSIIR